MPQLMIIVKTESDSLFLVNPVDDVLISKFEDSSMRLGICPEVLVVFFDFPRRSIKSDSLGRAKPGRRSLNQEDLSLSNAKSDISHGTLTILSLIHI